MNISKQALLAAEVAGDEAYAHGGSPEDVADAAVKAACRFIAAQVLRDAAEKVDVEGQDVNWEEDNYGAGRRHAANELAAMADALVGK